MSNYESLMTRARIEGEEEWRKWANKLPFFKFDSDWEVKIIPAFEGALIRFVVKKNDKVVSVYFDSESNLALMYDEHGEPIPYFEIYTDDVHRYLLNEVEQMMNDIRDYLK